MNLISFSLCLLEFIVHFTLVAGAAVICILIGFVLILILAVVFDKVIGFLENWW